tara:strand:+ start:967 stop:1551 length:585 start_codon:yes stop_codon:yes gene_type:complete
MPSEVGKCLGRGKKKGMTHREIMNKRKQRKKKKMLKTGDKKKSLIKEYMSLNSASFSTKKTTAMNIMEIVEEIKESGMNDKRYLDIMDQLMCLTKETDQSNNLWEDYIQSIENDETIGDELQDNTLGRRMGYDTRRYTDDTRRYTDDTRRYTDDRRDDIQRFYTIDRRPQYQNIYEDQLENIIRPLYNNFINTN